MQYMYVVHAYEYKLPTIRSVRDSCLLTHYMTMIHG